MEFTTQAGLSNQTVPQSNAETLHHSCDRYFEHHIKLLLEPLL